MSDYTGRHRPPTRAERRAIERRSRLPKSFSPAYALPTAAAATLVLSAAGATAAQSSTFAGGTVQAQGALAAPAPSAAAAFLEDPKVNEAARAEVADSTAEADDLAQRRQAVSTEVARDQGRLQERQRIARDKARKELAAKRASAEKKKEKEQAQETGSAPGGTATKGPEATNASVGSQGWVKPLDNAVFTSPFGMRWGRLHAGQDYAASVGTPLKAMSSGTVIAAGPMSGYGVYIDVKYWDGSVSRYGHLSSVSASVGQQVAPGDVVALSGNTGRSTGPHLHMEIHPGGGGAIDPAGWLAERGIS
ncbi:M23 family metallopeptidase [Janibacter terrae]|uniref:M23 family metallopeptidase n=1 Tax=Janibacter terrae TaxID=103817 RepID=UPI0031F7E074